MRLVPYAFGDHEGDVVVLFLRAELANVIDDSLEQSLRWHVAMPADGFDQAKLPEFLSRPAERLGDAVSVECERVSRLEPPLTYRAVPLIEEPDHRARGVQPLQRVIAAEEKSG